jgi:hypothetical protein
MTPTKIMVIRHAERPSDDGTIVGVSSEGAGDPEELTVQGWQRSGALVRLFKPFDGRFSNNLLATPDVIFASKVGHKSNSLRPQHTVLALASLLALKPTLVLDYAKGEEDAFVQDVMSRAGVVLIAWEHEAIPGIGNRITGDSTTCPQKWAKDRFDLIWVFDQEPAGQSWIFNQVPQMLLSGDKADPIPMNATEE